MTLQSPPRSVSFGCNPRRTVCGDGAFPVSTIEPLDEADWEEVDLSATSPRIESQPDGFCTGFGTKKNVENVRRSQGLEDIPLSATDLYYNSGGVWGRGISLDAACHTVRTQGIATLASVPNERHAKTPPPGERAQYRIDEYDDLDGDYQKVAAKLIKELRSCVIGIDWPGGGGHCVECDALKKQGGVWYFGGDNSWGEDWNGDGRWWLKPNQLRNLTTYGAWSPSSAIVPSLGQMIRDETMTMEEALRDAGFAVSTSIAPRKFRKHGRRIRALREAVVEAWPRTGSNDYVGAEGREQLTADLERIVRADNRVQFAFTGWLAWWIGGMILKWIILKLRDRWWEKHRKTPKTITL